jgi:hypothetical protein
MATKSHPVPQILAAMVVAATLATGCGDDDTERVATANTPELRGALQECLGEIRSNTEHGDAPISKRLRAALTETCKEAVGGGVPELRETAKEVCARVVERTVPRGALVYTLSLEQCKDGTRP